MLGLRRLEHQQGYQTNDKKGLSISVIVPFRNEARHLPNLLNDLVNQRGIQSFEVIWVDDHSEDKSVEVLSLVESYPDFHLLKLNDEAGKKAALTTGINRATGDIIVTTDADVRVSDTWLAEIVAFFEAHDADMQILPVGIKSEENKAQQFFQVAENLAIQAMTFGLAAFEVPISCNGANLAFRKSAFDACGGYESHRKTASGDDVLLMQQFVKAGFRVMPHWSEMVLVETSAAPSFKAAFVQRLRWAGKTGRMVHSWSLIAGSILLVHSLILITTIFFNATAIELWAIVLVVKVIVDVLLIKIVEQRYHQRLNPLKLAFIALVYIVYLPAITLISAIWKTKWKGRKT